ncbi:MAG: DUF7282 domain-containing protein, partial [Candidatus Promineifilaceae bacterium]
SGTPTAESGPTGAPDGEPTARPTRQATAAPSPTPEPPRPELTAEDQPLDEDGELTITHVKALEPGWVVVYADDGGRPGAVLGHAAVEEGETPSLIVSLDPFQATARLHIRLHVDGGEAGEFEVPGADRPAEAGGEEVLETILADLRFEPAAIRVADQPVGREGQVRVERVSLPAPGFLGLHLDDGGAPGRMVSFRPLPAGASHDVMLSLPWREATARLHAVLYQDLGEPGHFEYPDEDSPFIGQGSPAQASFKITLPPDIFVYEQPVLNGVVQVERAYSDGPGWLAAFTSVDGLPGILLGAAQLSDGVNQGITLSVTQSAVTPVILIRLHEDREPLGEFDFPGGDPPVYYQERLPNPIYLNTEPGSYLLAADQPLGPEDSLTVTLAVVEADAWLVAQTAGADGLPGEIVGQEWLAAGFNRDVVIQLDGVAAGDELFLTLHRDAGDLRQLEFPDGPDAPLEREEAPVRLLIRILGAAQAAGP